MKIKFSQFLIAILLLLPLSALTQKDKVLYFELDDSIFPVGAIYQLDSITFDFNASRIRPESKGELDRIVKFMNAHPTLSFEIRGHTDYRGNDMYNSRLSEVRAKSIQSYLVDRGILYDRLIPKGYGETKPYTVRQKNLEKLSFLQVGNILSLEFIQTFKDESQQEKMHQLNRRIELVITSN